MQYYIVFARPSGIYYINLFSMNVLGVCGAQGALLFEFKKYLVANVEPRAVFHSKKKNNGSLILEIYPL